MIVSPIAAAEALWHPIAVPGAPRRDTGGRLVYAIGDVHGCYDPFRRLLTLIAADAAVSAAGRTPILVLLGDYVDRGPASAEVLEAVAWLRTNAGYEVHALAGNHEQVMLDFLSDPVRGASWLDFGGRETLASYGVALAQDEEPDRAALLVLRDALRARLPDAHLALLQGLDLLVEIGDYAFAHAGIRPGVPLDRQSPQDLRWIRQGFLDSEAQHDRMIVHGHTWTGDRPQLESNRFGIDSGVYATDVLTALRLDGASAAYVQVGPAGR